MIATILWLAFIYVQVWWVTWFAVLPWKVQTVENPEPMHDPGAPEQAYIPQKLAVCSLISAVLTGVLWWAIKAGAWHWVETHV